MNKIILAEWLGDQGVDDDDITILKSRFIVTPFLYARKQNLFP